MKYEKCDATTRAGLDFARATEWDKWKQFNAGKIIRGDLLRELIAEGHKLIPTQWIEVDRNAHLRTEGKQVPPDLKSRLVGCGQFEDTLGVRTDSPTCELEGVHLLFSWASSNRLRLKSADVSNAYFQAKPLDRLILLKPPRGGLPGEDLHDAAIAARVPIYGFRDAGRGFWKQIRGVIKEAGFKPNHIMKALYSVEEDGEIKAMLVTHVDDIAWAVKPGYEHLLWTRS